VFSPSNAGVPPTPVCAVAVVRGIRGFGKGLTQSHALCSALGEALEQYAAQCVPRESLVTASYRELAGHAFDPRWLCLYSPKQYARPAFPYRPFDPDRPILWTSGSWLDSKEPVWLPASAVYLTPSLEQEEALCQGSSNGLAAGLSVSEAADHAVLELYERAEFIRAWLTCQGGSAYPLSDLPPEYACLAAIHGAQIEARILSADPYVSVCVARGDGLEWPGATLGLGVGTSAADAVAKAVLEHGQTGPFIASTWRTREVAIPSSPEAIRTFLDHALYYCDPVRAAELDFLRDADQAPLPAQRGVRFAVADITTPDLQVSPFRVVRVLSSGLQPIHCGYGFERALTPHVRTLLAGRMPNLAPIPIC
jgi:ribosomal protein S12 methylthiotransferase accessory factor